jgi:hypothetical protein
VCVAWRLNYRDRTDVIGQAKRFCEFRRHDARPFAGARSSDVRFGSLSDIELKLPEVCFTSESGHPKRQQRRIRRMHCWSPMGLNERLPSGDRIVL